MNINNFTVDHFKDQYLFFSLEVQNSCEEVSLEDIVVGKDLQDPNDIVNDLVPVNLRNGTFLISNKTSSKAKVGINRGASILNAIFDPTSVEVRARLTNNGTHWLVYVDGEVESCPGMIRDKLLIY